MDWSKVVLECGVVLFCGSIVFFLFRKHITPIKRLSTWFVAFFITTYAVDILNSYIAEANVLPKDYAHLPLQILAVSILVLYVPVRQEKVTQTSKEESKNSEDKRSARSNGGASSTSSTKKRRFKKK